MPELRRELVELNSLRKLDSGWEVTCYQTPEFLTLSEDKVELALLLNEALQREQSIWLSWETDSLKIVGAEKQVH